MDDRQQSPMFTKTTDFIVWLLEHTEKFPKFVRSYVAKKEIDKHFPISFCGRCIGGNGETLGRLVENRAGNLKAFSGSLPVMQGHRRSAARRHVEQQQ